MAQNIGAAVVQAAQPLLWWQRGVVYQIYPRSYGDTNGNGIGDLPGITAHLDYLRWLGVDAIWLSPFYRSPMADFGYDVADYTDVDPIFGTLADFDTLVREAHARDLKVIVDYVPNHTSNQHPWFVESRASRDNPMRDWYLWRDPAPDGGPPNNWISYFGGPAWECDGTTNQYYLHLFLKEQPDLNWRNPDVQRAMFDVLRFWMDRGVDGFRVDVMWLMIKDAQFRDNPVNPDWHPGMAPQEALISDYNADQPEVQEIVAAMRRVLDEYPERMMVGEIYLPIARLVRYYGTNGTGAQLPFNFQLVTLPWRAEVIGTAISQYEAALPAGAWPNWVLGNHDNTRVATRIGPAQARVAQMLLLTLRGTPTLYYGDEIGMEDVPIPPERVQDPPEKRQPGFGLGRDPERTPMQWNEGPNAGFAPAGANPWLPIAADVTRVNATAERDDPRSMLTLTRYLLTLRRETPALVTGIYHAISGLPDGCLAYTREAGGQRFLIALNLTSEPRTLSLADLQGEVVLSTHLDRTGSADLTAFELRGDEGCIIALPSQSAVVSR